MQIAIVGGGGVNDRWGKKKKIVKEKERKFYQKKNRNDNQIELNFIKTIKLKYVQLTKNLFLFSKIICVWMFLFYLYICIISDDGGTVIHT